MALPFMASPNSGSFVITRINSLFVYSEFFFKQLEPMSLWIWNIFEKGTSGSIKIQTLAQHWSKLPTVLRKKK
jgi:hypothetical protein